jgi:hypothetical protein
MQQKAMLKVSASRFARIKKTVNFDVISPTVAVSFSTNLCMLKRFHNLLFACRFFEFSSKSCRHLGNDKELMFDFTKKKLCENFP